MKFKLIVLMSILFLSISAVVIFLIFNLRIINDINVYQENLNKLTVNTVYLKNAFIDFTLSEHKNEFYELGRDEFSNAVFVSKNELSLINNELLKFKKARSYGLIPLLKQNQVIFNELEENFSMYKNNKKEIGNKKYGYIENIDHVEERMEIYLKDKQALYTDFINLKEYKINYLSSLSPEFAENFIIRSQEINQRLGSGNGLLDDKERRLITDANSEYLNLFSHIYNLHKIQGTDYYSGIYDEIDRLCDEVFININELNNSSKPLIIKDLQDFKIRMLILIFVSALIILMTIVLLYGIFRNGLYKINLRSKQLINSKQESSVFKAEDLIQNINNDLETHEHNLKEKELFVNQLNNENYDISDETVGNDKLGQALNTLRISLKNSTEKKKEEEQERIIRDKQNEGITKFGRILRRHSGDLDSLSYELISELVNYIDADIGGLYIADHNGDESVLRLQASYAYNERKMIPKEILFGEGLVGTCAVDRTTFYIDKIDENYIKIVSGFGYSKPESLLISPIFVENEVYGVLELAATRKFNENDIKFIDILAVDIAYTLSYLLSLDVKEDPKV